jgi:transcription elongation factor S-II
MSPHNALASQTILSRARAIELAVFNHHGGKVSADYRNKMRSLYMNLKDKKNPGLREVVLSGQLSAEKLSTMSAKVN